MSGWVTYLKQYNHDFFSVFLNKFPQHVFNSALKLNDETWKKKYKINFCAKKTCQTNSFAVVKKNPSSPWKKILSAYLHRKDVWKFLKNKWLSTYILLVILWIWRIINKMWMTKKSRKFGTLFWKKLFHKLSRKVFAS